MKIIISDVSGFCFGVKRAYSMCKKCFGRNFQTFGPLIHNPDILEKIKKNGGEIVDEIQKISSKTVFIRAHGISKNKLEKLEKKRVEIINTTCPFVERLQETANNFHKKGFKIFIIGQKKHPEILSITEDIKDAKVIFSLEDAKKIKYYKKICLVSQTTERQEKLEQILAILEKKCDQIEFVNTICTDVLRRQKTAKELSKKVELMIVVGGKNSSNTKKLYEICKQNCNTILIENEKEIDLKLLVNMINIKKLGICSGSSTSIETVNKVKEKIENYISSNELKR